MAKQKRKESRVAEKKSKNLKVSAAQTPPAPAAPLGTGTAPAEVGKAGTRLVSVVGSPRGRAPCLLDNCGAGRSCRELGQSPAAAPSQPPNLGVPVGCRRGTRCAGVSLALRGAG